PAPGFGQIRPVPVGVSVTGGALCEVALEPSLDVARLPVRPTQAARYFRIIVQESRLFSDAGEVLAEDRSLMLPPYLVRNLVKGYTGLLLLLPVLHAPRFERFGSAGA